MRYFDIRVGKSQSAVIQTDSGTTVTSAAGAPVTRWCSQTDTGANNGSAPQIIMDVPVAAFDSPMGAAVIQILGVDIKTVSQASHYARHPITVRAGMSGGLPLENASQAGQILAGQIIDAAGNWIGTNMNLTLVVAPMVAADDLNLQIMCPRGQPLDEAIKLAITSAYPELTVQVSVSDRLIANQTYYHYCTTLTGLSSLVKKWSQSIIKDADYPGVSVIRNGDVVFVFDTPADGDVVQIDFDDLVGQPTWVGVKQMQIAVVMRGDLTIGKRFTLTYTKSGGALASYGTVGPGSSLGQTVYAGRNKLIFSGTWQIRSLRHIGDSRTPDATSWVTTINAVQVTT